MNRRSSSSKVALVWLFYVTMTVCWQRTTGFQPLEPSLSSYQKYSRSRGLSIFPSTTARSSSSSPSCLSMGFLDDLRLPFMESREEDFVKLEDSQNAFGPGPLLVLANLPVGVTDDEIQDMLEDGAPIAFSIGVTLYRVNSMISQQDGVRDTSSVLDRTLQEALEGIRSGKYQNQPDTSAVPEPYPITIASSSSQPPTMAVAFFSGFPNDKEMLETYQILADEIHQESQQPVACAKAVPNAMAKHLRQVLKEIGGDHREALQPPQEEESQ